MSDLSPQKILIGLAVSFHRHGIARLGEAFLKGVNIAFGHLKSAEDVTRRVTMITVMK